MKSALEMQMLDPLVSKEALLRIVKADGSLALSLPTSSPYVLDLYMAT